MYHTIFIGIAALSIIGAASWLAVSLYFLVMDYIEGVKIFEYHYKINVFGYKHSKEWQLIGVTCIILFGGIITGLTWPVSIPAWGLFWFIIYLKKRRTEEKKKGEVSGV